MGGVEAIAAERRRQIDAEGWTPEHDDAHTEGEMASAAAAYALMGTYRRDSARVFWPWRNFWKPKSNRENLVRAGALIAAEIDRLDRAA